jgi:hypothetical protein
MSDAVDPPSKAKARPAGMVSAACELFASYEEVETARHYCLRLAAVVTTDNYAPDNSWTASHLTPTLQGAYGANEVRIARRLFWAQFQNQPLSSIDKRPICSVLAGF